MKMLEYKRFLPGNALSNPKVYFPVGGTIDSNRRVSEQEALMISGIIAGLTIPS